ncbi:HNH endonuclease [Arthrobacter sp. D1-29]
MEASNFAGLVEEFSRTVDYLQILSAGAVDRTRTQAITEANTRTRRTSASTASASTGTTGWVTGPDTGTETLPETDAAWPATSPTSTNPEMSVPRSPADDGCRNTAEFLRLRLRIGISEARRRLHLAHDTLPATTLTGDPTPPPREHLATALAPATGTEEADTEQTDTEAGLAVTGTVGSPVVSSRAGTIIATTLDRLRHHTTPQTLSRIEQHLTGTAATADPDFLTRVARRWSDTIDADGTEPSEEALRHTQGAFIRKPRHGLHRIEILATTDQYEHFLTVMNTATNPRTHTATGTAQGDGADGGGDGGQRDGNQQVWQTADLDRRTRSQKQLDGIITAIKAALTTNTLPTTGGNRPQILATINYQDLLPHLPQPTATHTTTGTGPGTGTGAESGTGNFTFTGPVAATTLRKIACDADIIPALLGTNSEILDLGRKTRLFTTAQRLALTARDQGCTFPNCTIPAPWCEAHHITYWSHGGPTTTNNGTLLCPHHHHLIHKEQWTIHTHHGTPWYTPPPHIDPHQKPQQNNYFKPPPPPQE